MVNNEVNISKELLNIFSYIDNSLKYDTKINNITAEQFIIAVMENKSCMANIILDTFLMSQKMNDISMMMYNELKNDNQCYIDNFIDFAKSEMKKTNSKELNSIHLLLGILNSDNKVKNILNDFGITYEMISSRTQSKQTMPIVSTKSQKQASSTLYVQNKVKKNKSTKVIDVYSIDLCDLSKSGKIDSVIGHDDIYEQIFNVFGRRNKNNVIIVGNGGVGKTSLVKNIANMINTGNVPVCLLKKKIIQFDPSLMIIGANFRGMFEDRFRAFVDELKQEKNYIVFIDDIHNSLNERAQEGSVNISSMIASILSESSIPFIATTNFKDYKNCIENNSSLKQKFQKIVIEPLSVIDTTSVLKNIKEQYENYHNVKYSEGSIKLCAYLADKYISDRFLPDSAIDIMDEAGSMISLKEKLDSSIEDIKEELNEIRNEKKKLLLNEITEGIEELNKKEETLKIRMSTRERDIRKYYKKDDVLENDIKYLISKKTGIPISKLNVQDKINLKNLNTEIKKMVIGQDDAVDKICQVIKRNRVGISNKNKPIVLFLFGQTGVGKTLIAKSIAKNVFGDEKALVRLDMSEYSEKSSVTKLTGSAPGYVGFENGGQLTETIKNKKYCVLLLDEIEKANQEVHNMFLQMFDEGHLTDNVGQKIDFKNVIILMTSNTGAKKMSDFGKNVGLIQNEEKNSKSILNKELKKNFSPEFLNRIDDIIYFNKLSTESLKKIITLELNKLEKRLNENGYRLDEKYFSNEYIDCLFKLIEGQTEYGARPIIRMIQDNIENKAADFILNDNFEFNEIPTNKIDMRVIPLFN